MMPTTNSGLSVVWATPDAPDAEKPLAVPQKPETEGWRSEPLKGPDARGIYVAEAQLGPHATYRIRWDDRGRPILDSKPPMTAEQQVTLARALIRGIWKR